MSVSRTVPSRALCAALTAATLAAAGGCAVEDLAANPADDERVAVQPATSPPISSIQQAEITFRATVATQMGAAAAAAGIPLGTSALAQAHVPRGRTVAAQPSSRGSMALLLSRSVARAGGAYAPGLYELSATAAGPSARLFDPARGFVAVAPPPPTPAGFHTPLGDDMCQNAPSLIQDYCQTIVACWGYDLFC
jgi:hypothetical protein